MRHYYSIVYTALIVSLFCGSLTAQDEAFRGGFGDGFSIDTLNEEFAEYARGSFGDGFSSTALISIVHEYSSGGEGDGFSNTDLIATFNGYYTGGFGDGFSTIESQNQFLDFSKGGNSDGFSHVFSQDDFNPMFSGGMADGFASDKYGHIIYWTGDVGTGWHVAGNWANGIIPSNCNPVVIPAGVPNFPAVNAGLLRIGYYKNEGDYTCQRINIEATAEMTTRMNCFVENYDLIFNQGKLLVKNPNADAFKNLQNGVILIKPNAQIIFKE